MRRLAQEDIKAGDELEEMKVMRRWRTAVLSSAIALAAGAGSTAAAAEPSAVTAPPGSFFELVSANDREPARRFYKKYLDAQGLPVVASAEVADQALERTRSIVTHLLAGRPDVLKAMISSGMYLIIIGQDQVYTDMPEYRNHPDPQFQNERVRGTGGRPTSFGEENLLSLPLDRYDDESIALHEFCHTIDGTLRSLDPTWNERKKAVYQNAVSNGRWKDAYTGSNPGEYWAEICQSYFDCNRVNNWNHNSIGTRERLEVYDPEGYELVRSTFHLRPENDWRYVPLRKLPDVGPPPARLKIDPYYTRFTWAREFTVVGRKASDQALLRANDTIRKVFAYRHDLLKALIHRGVKLVVLGREEGLADLPEVKAAGDRAGLDLVSRFLEYRPGIELLAVGEENVLGDPADPRTGECLLIRLLARAVHQVAATRAVDPDWEKRGRAVQQYELRVERMDVRFDDKLKELHRAALEKGKWKGTPAARDRVEYWAEGLLAYFDAAGQATAPVDAPRPINSRALLAEYDPGLHALVDETMAYRGHVDWRYGR
jgi:hypothetical protein